MTDIDVAAVLWSSISSGLTLACIRAHARARPPRWSSRGSGDGTRSEWRLCTVCLSETRGAARVHLQGRVWMRYRTPHWSGFGTAGPPATPAAFGSAIGAAQYRARHGTTAALVGGPLVEFVHTHDLTDGDPGDAGYFAAAAHPLSADEHYGRERGAQLPSFPARAAGRVGVEPRSPWVDAAVWRMVVLAERLGIVGATAVTEHALRTVFTAVGGRLPDLLGMPPVRPRSPRPTSTPLPPRRWGTKSSSVTGRHVVADCTSDRLWDGHPDIPAAVRDTAVRAWSAALPHHEWDLRVRSIPSGAGSRTMVFDRVP
jgi:hypothetical protein